jgi:hypothetical protein
VRPSSKRTLRAFIVSCGRALLGATIERILSNKILRKGRRALSSKRTGGPERRNPKRRAPSQGKYMSEEQPQFKVTDRRLFNADGTPREIAEEEAADKTESASAAQVAEAVAPAASAASGEQSQAAAASSAEPVGAARQEEPQPEPEEEVAGADDPASFVNFLMSIASNAAASLGMMEHPVTGERGVDLQLGKHWIDVLGMLQQKTRGNLTSQENQIMDGLLSDLRMQFVSLTKSAPSARQRFTGRDILGGK